MVPNTDMGMAMASPQSKPDSRLANARLFPRWLRLAMLPVAVLALVASVIHASSESGVKPLAATVTLDSSLNAETRARLVDAQFRMQLAQDVQDNGTPERVPAALSAEAETVRLSRPLDVGMIRILATGEVAFEDRERALEIMKRLVEINRRDPIANMWLIQEYGARGEILPMLSIFDQTLRTNRDVRASTMPAFVGLLNFPEGQTAILDMLAQDPDWGPEFWAEFAKNSVALANAEAFFGQDRASLASLDDEYRGPIFQGLKAAGLNDALFRLADASGNAGDQSFSDGGFVEADSQNPFGWDLTSTGKYATMVTRDGKSLSIDAEPGSFGVAAQRLVRAPASGEISIELAKPLDQGSRVEARLLCADATKETIASARIFEGGSSASGQIGGDSCDYATLALIITVSARRQSAEIQVESAKILP